MSLSWRHCLAFVAVCALAFGMVACAKEEAPPPPPPPTTAAPAVEPEPAGEFGVAECDDYVKAYMACVEEKVPEEQRAALTEGLNAAKEAWKAAAATEEGKAGLAAACTEAKTAAMEAVKAFGCDLEAAAAEPAAEPAADEAAAEPADEAAAEPAAE